jgi:predicted dehydrogenase
MSDRLKVAVLGAGLIATAKHLPALRNLKGSVELCGVCDIDLAQASKAVHGFPSAKPYTDLARLLAEQKPDIVDICTPPKLHAAMALRCLDAGAHLVIEKPLAQTVEECDRIIEAAKRAGRQVCVAHSDLFYPAFVRARQAVDEGRIGRVVGMRIHLSTPRDYITSKRDHWAHALPGGVFGESGPHVVYMTLAYLNRVREVRVLGRKLLPEYPWSAYEDYRVELVGDALTCTATLTYATSQWGAEVELWGTDGTIRIDLESQTMTRRSRKELKAIPVGISALTEAAQIVTSGARSALERVLGRSAQTHQELLQAFVAALRAGDPSPVPAEQGRESIRVMNLITQQLDAASGLAGTDSLPIEPAVLRNDPA